MQCKLKKFGSRINWWMRQEKNKMSRVATEYTPPLPLTAMHCRLKHVCFMRPGPPNLRMSLQRLHSPQSWRVHASHALQRTRRRRPGTPPGWPPGRDTRRTDTVCSRRKQSTQHCERVPYSAVRCVSVVSPTWTVPPNKDDNNNNNNSHMYYTKSRVTTILFPTPMKCTNMCNCYNVARTHTKLFYYRINYYCAWSLCLSPSHATVFPSIWTFSLNNNVTHVLRVHDCTCSEGCIAPCIIVDFAPNLPNALSIVLSNLKTPWSRPGHTTVTFESQMYKE